MRQQDGSDRDLGSPFIDGEFFAAGNEEWTSRLRLFETESPYADGLNEVAEEGVVFSRVRGAGFHAASGPSGSAERRYATRAITSNRHGRSSCAGRGVCRARRSREIQQQTSSRAECDLQAAARRGRTRDSRFMSPAWGRRRSFWMLR